MYQIWILLQCIASMTVNNHSFQWHKRNEHWTWNSLLLHVSHELDNFSQGHHQELDWKQEADAQLACFEWTYPLLMTSLFVWICDMITLASLLCPVSLKCFNFMLMKLFAVTCDLRCRYRSVHISLVPMKQRIGYWLSLKQCIGLILY